MGGPTANFYNPACEKQNKHGVCTNRECLFPQACPQLQTDESDYLDVLRTLRTMPGIKKVFVRSGIRYDYMLKDKESTFFKELVEHHVSGQLRVAPEHVSTRVLKAMGKPSFELYEQFLDRFNTYNKERKQFVVPYFISGHPGSRLEDAILLAEYIRDHKVIPEQVQGFYPTPGTIATAMYFTGIHPLTGDNIHIPKGKEKQMQRALLQYNKKENRKLVRDALIELHRWDLIGNHPKALVSDDEGHSKGKNNHKNKRGRNYGKRRKTSL